MFKFKALILTLFSLSMVCGSVAFGAETGRYAQKILENAQEHRGDGNYTSVLLEMKDIDLGKLDREMKGHTVLVSLTVGSTETNVARKVGTFQVSIEQDGNEHMVTKAATLYPLQNNPMNVHAQGAVDVSASTPFSIVAHWSSSGHPQRYYHRAADIVMSYQVVAAKPKNLEELINDGLYGLALDRMSVETSRPSGGCLTRLAVNIDKSFFDQPDEARNSLVSETFSRHGDLVRHDGSVELTSNTPNESGSTPRLCYQDSDNDGNREETKCYDCDLN